MLKSKQSTHRRIHIVHSTLCMTHIGFGFPFPTVRSNKYNLQKALVKLEIYWGKDSVDIETHISVPVGTLTLLTLHVFFFLATRVAPADVTGGAASIAVDGGIHLFSPSSLFNIHPVYPRADRRHRRSFPIRLCSSFCTMGVRPAGDEQSARSPPTISSISTSLQRRPHCKVRG